MEIRGKSVLLTGATGGIGHAIARALAGRGAALILTGRRADVLEPLAAETGGRALPCDLADRAALERLVQDAADVDILVANAALPGSGPLLGFSDAEIDRVLDVNLRAPIYLARHLGERMAGRGSGHVLFVSSLAGKSTAGGSSVYSATKYGLRGFSLALREDMRPSGVGVSTVFPGFIRDAGMFAETEVKLPRFTGTSTPDQVAAGVIRAIERNCTEVDVAPFAMRIGARFAGVAPGPVIALQRRLGGDRVADEMAEAQRAKR